MYTGIMWSVNNYIIGLNPHHKGMKFKLFLMFDFRFYRIIPRFGWYYLADKTTT